jgi:hypothetical protein
MRDAKHLGSELKMSREKTIRLVQDSKAVCALVHTPRKRQGYTPRLTNSLSRFKQWLLHHVSAQKLKMSSDNAITDVILRQDVDNKYQYSALRNAGAIRLLRVDVGGETPSYSLIETDIHSAPPYVAISYVWGDPTTNIISNCQVGPWVSPSPCASL